MTKTTFARLVSIIGHPFTFIVLLLLVPFWRSGDLRTLRVTGLVVVLALIPLALFMRHRHATGRWQTVDASAPVDRPAAYIAIFAVLVPFMFYFRFVEHSPALVRGSTVLALMLLVGAFLNRWIKLSGHVAFAAFAALIFIRINPALGTFVFLFLPVLAWSRIALGRHTLPEVLGGFFLGLVAAAIVLWL